MILFKKTEIVFHFRGERSGFTLPTKFPPRIWERVVHPETGEQFVTARLVHQHFQSSRFVANTLIEIYLDYEEVPLVDAEVVQEDES